MVSPVPKIKFCGLTSVGDAQAAVAAGAWAIGLIFWPGSVRRCRTGAAVEIAATVKRQVEIVGVFVNPTLEELVHIAEEVGLTMIQLHGDEGPAFCAEAGRRTGCRVIKAVRVRGQADLQALAAFPTDYHLLDSYSPDRPGGTGESFSWEIARGHRGETPVIVSGGLTPANVTDAIAVVRPFAVDVATGVELSPGVKDPDKLRRFAQSVHEAGPHAARPPAAHARPGGGAHARPRTPTP